MAFIVYLPQWRQADTCHLICNLPWLLPTCERVVIKTSVGMRRKKEDVPVGACSHATRWQADCSNLSISTTAL